MAEIEQTKTPQVQTEATRKEPPETNNLKSWGESVLKAVTSTNGNVTDDASSNGSSTIERAVESVSRTNASATVSRPPSEEVVLNGIPMNFSWPIYLLNSRPCIAIGRQ